MLFFFKIKYDLISKKNACISLKNIGKICEALNCKIEDVVEFNFGGHNE
ncbi:helix-turn-helix domain-containing protein [Mycoplasmopsis pullorum]